MYSINENVHSWLDREIKYPYGVFLLFFLIIFIHVLCFFTLEIKLLKYGPWPLSIFLLFNEINISFIIRPAFLSNTITKIEEVSQQSDCTNNAIVVAQIENKKPLNFGFRPIQIILNLKECKISHALYPIDLPKNLESKCIKIETSERKLYLLYQNEIPTIIKSYIND